MIAEPFGRHELPGHLTVQPAVNGLSRSDERCNLQQRLETISRIEPVNRALPLDGLF